MAFKTDLDVRILLANTTGTLVNITAYLTSASIRGAQELIEDTGLSDTAHSFLPGKVGATIPLAGMVNTTTDALFGPLIGARTSATRKIEYQSYKTSTNTTGNVGQFYSGNVYLSGVEYSGSLKSLETFSVEATFDGAVTRTSQSTT